jgi:hypothetical protein
LEPSFFSLVMLSERIHTDIWKLSVRLSKQTLLEKICHFGVVLEVEGFEKPKNSTSISMFSVSLEILF